jgi:hypothetical protein
MEPTPDEAAAMSEIQHCFAWAGMDGAHLPALLDHMGMQAESPIRQLAAASPDDITETLRTWQVGGGPPPLGLRTQVRLAWTAAKKASTVNQQPGQAGAANDQLGGLLADLGVTRLSSAMRLDFEAQFRRRYPNELITDQTWPSEEVIRRFYDMHRSRNWQWVGWRQLLSKSQALQLAEKRKSTRTADTTLIRVLAAQAGLQDEEVEEMNSTPYRVQQVMSVRMYAQTLVNFGHLNNFKQYMNTFMERCTKRPADAAGMRPPNWEEAEAADREIWGEITRLVDRGWSWDDSMHEVTVARDVITTHLQPRLRPPQPQPKSASTKGGTGKVTGKGETWQQGKAKASWKTEPYVKGTGKRGKDAAKSGSKAASNEVCERWQTGNCRNATNCRYKHICKWCRGDHPGASCTGAAAGTFNNAGAGTGGTSPRT